MEIRDLTVTEKVDFRLAALEATNRLQREVGFADESKANVENTIYNMMRDAFQRGMTAANATV